MKHSNKIYIIGPEGAGKSTTAETISKKLRIKHYDLDNVVWSRRYDIKRSHEARLKILKTIVKKKKWVIEGIFGGWTEPAFKNADLVVMLNLDYHLLAKNLFRNCFLGKSKGMERHKTKLSTLLKLLIHVKKYRIRDHPKSYSGHMELIKKYKANFIDIRNNIQLKEFIDKVK